MAAKKNPEATGGLADMPDAAPANALVKVRVLVDCDLGKCNDVVEVGAGDLDGLAGIVDATPEAVDYAESLSQ